MKKFYIPIFTAVLLASSFLSQGQTVYNSILSNPSNWTLDDARFWVGAQPPNPCTDCQINIFANVSMVQNGSSTDATHNCGGCTFLNDVIINGTKSSINVIGNTKVSVNTYLQLFKVKVILGNNATDAGKFFVNDQILMDAASSVRIGNDLSYLDANNAVNNPVIGPITDFANGGTPDAGIYGALAVPVGGENYSLILNVNGIGFAPPGGAFAFYGDPAYISPFNCPGAAPAGCAAFGIVNGPAATGPNATFGVVFAPSAILPVQLVQFLADKNDDGSVKLSWATAQELNANDFEIERSGDQAKWTTLGAVKAKGYSSTTTNYSFTDKEPIDGKGYYRLKMVDLDQKFEYSPTVAVSSNSTNNQALIIYKNPYNDMIRTRVHVSRAQNLVLTVTDMVGRTYISQNYPAQAGNNYINLQPNVGSSGMYILRIHGDSYDQTVKIEKQ